MMISTGGKKMILISGIIYLLKFLEIPSWNLPVERADWLMVSFVMAQITLD
jgi:hypothetical protein